MCTLSLSSPPPTSPPNKYPPPPVSDLTPPLQRVIALYVVSAILEDSRDAQVGCLAKGLHAVLALQLADPHPLVRAWVCLAAARLWRNYDDARAKAASDKIVTRVALLVNDSETEVSAAWGGWEGGGGAARQLVVVLLSHLTPAGPRSVPLRRRRIRSKGPPPRRGLVRPLSRRSSPPPPHLLRAVRRQRPRAKATPPPLRPPLPSLRPPRRCSRRARRRRRRCRRHLRRRAARDGNARPHRHRLHPCLAT
jgi:hypothetical protein